MSYAPIALTMPQYEDYPNNWLKAYEQGSDTPLSMATDATGGTTLAKAELDSAGFPITAASARFIPFLNASYDLWLFPTEADADSDDTTNAIQLADNLNPINDTVTSISTASYAAAGGTVDVITATLSPAVTSYTNGLQLNIRASGANTVTTPTLNINGLGAKTITKIGNQALRPGDIPKADYEMILRYNSTNDVAELLNPALYPALTGEVGITSYEYRPGDVRRYGVTGDGSTDDTAALVNADTSGAAIDGILYIYGTPLITSTFTPTCRSIFFDGAPGNFSGRYPDSYLIKDAAMTTTGMIVDVESPIIINGGVVGVAGNTGDNIQLTAHSVRWDHMFTTLAGQDGYRIGEAASGAPNSNKFRLDSPCATNNGRYGGHISDDDAGGAPNANAGTIISPFFGTNGSHGLYINNCFGNTIEGILSQSNVGKGVYLDERSVSNTFIGGDIEANTSGAGVAGSDLVTVTSVLAAGGQYGGNAFINTNIGTPPTDDATMTSRGWQGFDGFGNASGTGSINAELPCTLTIAGTTTPGTNTYSTQNCEVFKNGRMITVMFDLALSGNTVAMAGNLRLSGLPVAVLSGNLGAWSPGLILNLTFPASVTTIVGALNGTNLDIYGYGDNIGLTPVLASDIGAANGRLSGVITYVSPAVKLV